MVPHKKDQDAQAHADKEAWREREGWCTAEEAEIILLGKDSPRIVFVSPDQAVKSSS